mmetsp:Transcript_11707/g.31552  ORF Transcript_11707/g.31552 Transcript_11707/m.31552 type:complete len:266 (-) Transcript_11707:125-922(-)
MPEYPCEVPCLEQPSGVRTRSTAHRWRRNVWQRARMGAREVLDPHGFAPEQPRRALEVRRRDAHSQAVVKLEQQDLGVHGAHPGVAVLPALRIPWTCWPRAVAAVARLAGLPHSRWCAGKVHHHVVKGGSQVREHLSPVALHPGPGVHAECHGRATFEAELLLDPLDVVEEVEGGEQGGTEAFGIVVQLLESDGVAVRLGRHRTTLVLDGKLETRARPRICVQSLKVSALLGRKPRVILLELLPSNAVQPEAAAVEPRSRRRHRR